MRKISALLLAVFVGAFIAGCGKSEQTPPPAPGGAVKPPAGAPAPAEKPAE